MRVLVTGGSGNVGGYVVEELIAKHDVTILDVNASKKHPDLPLVEMDLTSLDRVVRTIKGFDAVVHLAAIPNPRNDPGDRVLGVNTVSAYNVLEAVRLNGIRRIVYACSESASGFGIHNTWYKPEYVPIDENHPSWPHESYSLSKYFGEVMCREYSRAYGIEAVSLRYGWVWFGWDKDALLPMLKNLRPSPDNALGAYVFAEDVAQAFGLALDYKLTSQPPFESFYIMADVPALGTDSLEQIHLLYPNDPPPVREAYFEANPRASLFDTSKAKRELGYKPRKSYLDWLDG